MFAIIFKDISIDPFISLSCKTHAPFDEIHIDLRTELHAVLELVLVIGLGALGLDVLLDGIDLRLVLNQLLLNVIQSVVDFRLQDLVLLGIVPHRVVSHLL